MWGNTTLLEPLIGASKLFRAGVVFSGCFWWLAFMGVKGGSERRFEVTGTLRVPDDLPRRWRTRYLRKALAQLLASSPPACDLYAAAVMSSAI